MIPRRFLSIRPVDGLWRAYYRVGNVLCWFTGSTIREAADGLVAFVDEKLVAILATDPATCRALSTIH